MRIRPYIKDGEKKNQKRSKIKPEQGEPITKQLKQEIKNANRAIKKAYRQELKRQTDEEVNQFLKNKKPNE